MKQTIDADVYLQATVAQLTKRGRVRYAGSLVKATAAFPLHVLAGCQALAERSEESRSRVITLLVDLGLRTVREAMKPAELAELDTMTAECARKLMSDSEQGEI